MYSFGKGTEVLSYLFTKRSKIKCYLTNLGVKGESTVFQVQDHQKGTHDYKTVGQRVALVILS
jgi:hypothetical protein